MKTVNPLVLTKAGTAQHSPDDERILRAIRAALRLTGWSLLVLAVLLTGYATGLVSLAVVLLGIGPSSEFPPLLLVLLVLDCALAWLVARFISTWRSVLRVVGVILILQLVIGTALALAWPDRALYLARVVAWGDSGMLDYEKFPSREIHNAPPAYTFEENLSPELFQTIEYRSEGQVKEAGFEEFLQSTQTTSFIVIQDDAILYEGYFNGYSRDSIVTSFSVAKSFTSALVGIAIDEGYIGGVNDPVIEYIPELKGRGLDGLTIRHLLDMSSGIRHVPDDEVSLLGELTQFSDGKLAYYYPDMRSLALGVQPDGELPGTSFNYNKYHPLLLGLILERTTGRPVAEYLQEKIWKPLGMEYPASWSLDSRASGFEKMESGINARAIDFARFGNLFLNNGEWNGAQIISEAWVKESTSSNQSDNRPWRSYADWKEADGYYKYLWWGQQRPGGVYDYSAQGHLGQWIYVSPQEQVVIVRFGLDEGGVDSWTEVFQTLIGRMREVSEMRSKPSQNLPTSSPEEQGFDSARLAAGLRAIRQNGTAIHSLMAIRNGAVFLEANFYPYDGSLYHDLASVTKSVMTTLIGIAADQGRLSLEDPLLSFFPERTIANRDERKERITVRHLASMTAGLACNLSNDEVTMDQMRSSEDWVQFALDRRIVQEPGTRFIYCGLQMHLLSAILQEATGMTALEFSQENLFEPLGIQEAYWPADLQGYTHGWGDLCLRPGDMAKLGLLFLNRGRWEDRQIVSEEWVIEANRKQAATGSARLEDYGYGWWVGRADKEAEFLAVGNGGQKIKVYPNLDLIIVMTGGGFEYAEIEAYFLASMIDLEKALPANPGGQAQLAAVLAEVAQPPAAQPVPALPSTAKAISGQTYIFEPNSLNLRSARLEFDSPAEATLQIELVGEASPRVSGVGLDGNYRPSRKARPVLARGRWADDQTFVVEYNEGPGMNVYRLQFYFEGSRLEFKISGLRRAGGLTIEARPEDP